MTTSTAQHSPSWNAVTYVSVALSIVIGVAMLVMIVPAMRVFPTADERVYIDPIASGSTWELLKFFLGAHGDHRIPFQKALQTPILIASGMDFSALITVNILLATSFSVNMTLLCLYARGVSLVGDLLIPLLAQPFTAAFLFIGFNATFLLDVYFAGAAALFFVRAAVFSNRLDDRLGYASLFVGVWTGLSGAVMAAVLAIMITSASIYLGGTNRRFRIYAGVAIIVSAVFQFALWWFGFRVSMPSQPIDMLASQVYNAIASGLFNFARPGYWWKSAIIVGVFLSSLLVLARRRKEISFTDVIVIALALSSIAVLVVVAKGRGVEPWSARFDGHYGYLSIFIPLSGWLLISMHVRRAAANLLGICLVAFFGVSFYFNMVARIGFLEQEGPSYRAIQRDFASTKPASEIVNEQPLLRYNDDHPQSYLDSIAREIDTLRRIGGWQYRDH